MTLLRVGPSAPHPGRLVVAAARSAVPPTMIDTFDPAAGDVYDRPLVLVRPDWYVAWSGHELQAGCDTLLDLLRGA
jgi:hypothetical protein